MNLKQVIVVMGVSGCGKTTISEKLAKELQLPCFDADDFHSQANIDKMKNNQPLNDQDRQPWLQTLANELNKWQHTEGAIFACSALKESYRELLASKAKVTWVYLYGSYDIIASRMALRGNHYMKSDLLQSQFNALEVPNYGIHVNIELSIEEIVQKITKEIKQEIN